MAVVSAIFMGSVWAGENRAVINNFKRQNPTAFVFLLMVASYILISLLGSVMVFMSAITFPLACKFKRFNVAEYQKKQIWVKYISATKLIRESFFYYVFVAALEVFRTHMHVL